jgi:hypothetical protein
VLPVRGLILPHARPVPPINTLRTPCAGCIGLAGFNHCLTAAIPFHGKKTKASAIFPDAVMDINGPETFAILLKKIILVFVFVRLFSEITNILL